MSNSSDIKNLFAKFGGHPEHYRELAHEHDARASTARWPMLTNISANRASHPPQVESSPLLDEPVAENTRQPSAKSPSNAAHVMHAPGPVPTPGLMAGFGRRAASSPTATTEHTAVAAPPTRLFVPTRTALRSESQPVPQSLPSGVPPTGSPFAPSSRQAVPESPPATPLQHVFKRLSQPEAPPTPSSALPPAAPTEARAAPVSSLLSRLAKR